MEKAVVELYENERKNWLEWNRTELTTKQCESCGLVGYTEKENKWKGTPRKIIFYEGRVNYPWGCQNWRACQKDQKILFLQLENYFNLKKQGIIKD